MVMLRGNCEGVPYTRFGVATRGKYGRIREGGKRYRVRRNKYPAPRWHGLLLPRSTGDMRRKDGQAGGQAGRRTPTRRHFRPKVEGLVLYACRT